MMLRIPKELQRYVRMSRKEGLVYSDDMPMELLPLFEETKRSLIRAEQERRNDLEKLIAEEE